MKKIVPVILAGGIGERFWPLSRSSHPKQLLALTSRRTMVEETFLRAAALQSKGVKPLLITGKPIASRMKALMAKKWPYDLIVEPVGKNTAPALALAAAWIEARYGDSLMLVFPADHMVSPPREFAAAVRYACTIADTSDHLVVFGIAPTRPDTGYGYIHLGKETGAQGSVKSYKVSRFVEKPDDATAAKYCAEGSYRWNSGMFVWKTSVLLEEVATSMPELSSQVRAAARKRFSSEAIDKFYHAAHKESIDYGIMERSKRVSAVAGKFFWDDIGSWEAIGRLSGSNEAGSTVVGERVYEAECTGSMIINKSPHALAAIGLSDAVVVATGDAVLVIARSKLPQLKKYLEQMKKGGSLPKHLF